MCVCAQVFPNECKGFDRMRVSKPIRPRQMLLTWALHVLWRPGSARQQQESLWSFLWYFRSHVGYRGGFIVGGFGCLGTCQLLVGKWWFIQKGQLWITIWDARPRQNLYNVLPNIAMMSCQSSRNKQITITSGNTKRLTVGSQLQQPRQPRQRMDTERISVL